MMDLLYLAATLGFFASCGALVRLATRLMPEAPRVGAARTDAAPEAVPAPQAPPPAAIA
ncbi:MAG TPA: hypothetical protein VK610_02300 [Rhodothermales bacterium]|nr:hypothetical protein [Rhodothermales bacterium]